MNQDETEKYEVRVNWAGGKSGEVTADNRTMIRTGSPADSEDEFYSPEELFIASGAVCFMNSFLYFLDKMHINVESFEIESIGLLEKVGRSFEITEIQSNTHVVIDKNTSKKKVERALELGAKYCFVANSMKCPTYHEHEIVMSD